MNNTLLAYAMLTENTGQVMTDSGGIYGRHYEKNKKQTMQEFIDMPSATLTIENVSHLFPLINVFHVIANFETDSFCDKFNKKSCKDWESDYFGVSKKQFKWLNKNGFSAQGDGQYTYNWQNNFSQDLQYQGLYHEPSDSYYMLVQVHNGCDARMGMTDAKLFYAGNYEESLSRMMDDCCNFSVESDSEHANDDGFISLEWRGEFITYEGCGASDEYLEAFAKSAGYIEDTISIDGSYSEPDI